jgi:hypothetical protein
MSRRFLPVFVIILTAVATTAFTFGLGGWAVITVEDLPGHLVAGKPVELSFLVRQHGMTLLNGLRPTVFAKSGKTEVQASAIPGKKNGGYTATLVVPATGEWTITIASGFLNNTSTLAPLSAVAPGAPAPRVMAAADRGRQLFIAKDARPATCTARSKDRGASASGRISRRSGIRRSTSRSCWMIHRSPTRRGR